MKLPEGSKRQRAWTKHGISASKTPIDELIREVETFNRQKGFQHHSTSVSTHFSSPTSSKERSPERKSPYSNSMLDGMTTSSSQKHSSEIAMEIDVDGGSLCDKGFTRLGRYRAWHPESSVVKDVPRKEGCKREFAPSTQEIEDEYNLPLRRLRPRDDGVGGAVLFQPTEEPPVNVEEKISQVIQLRDGAPVRCEFPDREGWNSVLEGNRKTGLKRGLGPQSREPRKKANITPPKETLEVTRGNGINAVSSPSPETDLVLEYVKTGDDAVKFFVENEGQTRVKFFYCNRADTGKIFSPYDLVIVKRVDVHPEYFTVSSSGLVHIEPGNGSPKESTFIPLKEWVREKFVFKLLRRIHFFGKYLPQKCFNIWRKHIGQSHFKRVREALVQKLFFAKPAFITALCKIYSFVYELTELDMLSITTNHLYNLEDFARLQTEQRTEKVGPIMDQITDKVQDVLAKICSEARKQAQIYRESVRDEAELDDIIGVNLHQTRGSKVQSMVSIKQEKIERAKTYRRVVAEEKMLGNFIRLADYMFVEALAHRAITTAEEMLDMLEFCRTGLEKASKGVFLSTVSFGATAVAFTPDEPGILNVLNNTMDGVVNAVQAAPRILHMRVFLPFFDSRFVGMNPLSIIKMTPYANQVRELINQAVTEDFAAARQYAQIFEEHRALFMFGETWNFEAYAAEKRSVRQYREEMARQREWRIELERMRTAK